MSQRQCGRAEPPACCGPLRFSVLSGREKAPSDLGLAFRVKLSRVVRVRTLLEFLAGPYLHDQARGCSRYFPRPLSSLFDARRKRLARRSRTSALLVPRTPQPVPKT